MNRRRFLRWLGIGAAVAPVVPMVARGEANAFAVYEPHGDWRYADFGNYVIAVSGTDAPLRLKWSAINDAEDWAPIEAIV